MRSAHHRPSLELADSSAFGSEQEGDGAFAATAATFTTAFEATIATAKPASPAATIAAADSIRDDEFWNGEDGGPLHRC